MWSPLRPPRAVPSTSTRSVPLDPGENAIEVVAYNASQPARLAAGRRQHHLARRVGRRQGRLHVLAIGIDAYDDRIFRRLRLAVTDAMAFGAAMEKVGRDQYEAVHVDYVLDDAATPAGISEAIERLSRRVRLQDTFILFAAAHGTSENGRFYLVPKSFRSDAPGSLADKAIGQDQLQDWLVNRIKAKQALVLLDTCESGALIGGHIQSRTEDASSETAIGRLHEATGRPVLTAAASGKVAIEGYRGHGVFTWALLDALRNGDTNGNGLVELGELVAHVQAAVPKISAAMRVTAGRSYEARAALTTPTSDGAGASAGRRQSARFGSRGEDFVIGQRLP